MKLDTLEKLFVHELKDLHSAESQLIDALPAMQAAATNGDLKEAFRKHHSETKEHLARLDQLFTTLDFEPGGHRCRGMEGLIEEGKGMIDSDANEHVRDAGLICAAQRVEHYEMAGYGSAAALALKLGNQEAAKILRTTLEEEGKTDRDLTHIAERIVNFEALTAKS